MQLEEMSAFFENRVGGYDEHMRSTIEGSSEFYAFTAGKLPKEPGARVLDLGCGTGLELEEYFSLNPDAEVTGIDLCQPMLDALAAKFPDRKLERICGSYFDTELIPNYYDAAVSVESLHHFPAEQKRMLYRRLFSALKEGGQFVLTDYFAESEELEKEYFENLKKLKREQHLDDGRFYHYDTPLTVEHEMEILTEAGFGDVRILQVWGSTCTVLAGKTGPCHRQDPSLKIEMIRQGHPLWEKTIRYAQGSSWQAGPFLAAEMRKNAFQDWERVIVAVDRECIVGYSVFAEKDELPEKFGYAPFVGFVFVDERYRGRRISEQMIDQACRYAKELGYPAVYIMSGEYGLYEKYGFEKIGAFETIFGTTDQLFRKTL